MNRRRKRPAGWTNTKRAKNWGREYHVINVAQNVLDDIVAEIDSMETSKEVLDGIIHEIEIKETKSQRKIGRCLGKTTTDCGKHLLSHSYKCKHFFIKTFMKIHANE